MDLLGSGGGVLVNEQPAQLAQAIQAPSPLGPEHTDPAQRRKIAARVELVATPANLGELEAEGGELGDVVPQLVDAPLDCLNLVEARRLVGVISRAKLVKVEVLAELRHRHAQRDQVAAHVADAVTNLRLQRPGTIGVMGLERRGRRRRGRHRFRSGIASASGTSASAARACHALSWR